MIKQRGDYNLMNNLLQTQKNRGKKSTKLLQLTIPRKKTINYLSQQIEYI